LLVPFRDIYKRISTYLWFYHLLTNSTVWTLEDKLKHVRIKLKNLPIYLDYLIGRHRPTNIMEFLDASRCQCFSYVPCICKCVFYISCLHCLCRCFKEYARVVCPQLLSVCLPSLASVGISSVNEICI
jgi:hypothetical protein